MPTWSDAKALVKSELDLEQEDFINDTDLLTYANRALNTAENLILTLNEDYFLNKELVSLINGTVQYDLPETIYAQKIRRILYSNGSIQFEIRRIKNISDTAVIRAGEDYRYVITNDPDDGLKLNLYPTPNISGQYLTIWFLRNATEITEDADEIDLPEAYDYFCQYIKDCCVNKERGTPDAPPSGALQYQEKLLIEALTDRFPDEDNTPEMDLSFYREVN